MLSLTDRLLGAADSALRTLLAQPQPARPSPAAGLAAADPLDEQHRRLSGALMRVNHVGEVCAQALYQAQALTSRSEALRQQLDAAAREETDHLAWTRERLQQLGSRPSWLNPLWYAGAFGIGVLAGKLGGDRVNLGFVVETERQVEAHLAGHMERLPAADAASRGSPIKRTTGSIMRMITLNTPVIVPSQMTTLAARNSGKISMKYQYMRDHVLATTFDSRGMRSGGISR